MNDKELFKSYLERVDSINDRRYLLMKEDVYNGQTSYLRMKFKGSSVFNPEWINRIEDCMYELDQITNNPREVTTSEGSIIPIELARKINYESVQHLASHSQFIKEIDENGNVIPAKILGLFNKEELHTYENRFIATFIRRLILFIDKRYEFIQNTINLDEKEIMYVKNKSIVDGQEVEIETKVTVTRKLEDDLTITARDYIERIKKLKEYIGYYYNSPFMKEFKTDKDVRRPIILTNILKKNPLYHKCYETFLFIEKFESLGVTYNVDRTYQDFNENERRKVSKILVPNLLYLENTENNKVYNRSRKTYKPKLLSSIDDESFLYDDLVKGPVEFVRADESYLAYLHKKIPTNLPTKPTKAEREYYKDLYDLKHDLNKEINGIDALLARVRKMIEKYEKKVQDLIAAREIEEAKLYEEYLKALRQYEQDILDKKRAEIIAAAKLDRAEVSKSSKKKKDNKTTENTAKGEQIVEKPTEDEEIPVSKQEEEIPVFVEPKVDEEEPITVVAPLSEESELVEETKEVDEAKDEGPIVEVIDDDNEEVEPIYVEVPEPVNEPTFEDEYEGDVYYIVSPDMLNPDGSLKSDSIPYNNVTPNNNRYIVKNDKVFYVSKDKRSIFRKDAFEFDNYEDALEASREMNGKVLKVKS